MKKKALLNIYKNKYIMKQEINMLNKYSEINLENKKNLEKAIEESIKMSDKKAIEESVEPLVEKAIEESVEQQENITKLEAIINYDIMTDDQYNNATNLESNVESESEPNTSEDE